MHERSDCDGRISLKVLNPFNLPTHNSTIFGAFKFTDQYMMNIC